MRYLILGLLSPLLAFAAGKIINADIAPSGTANIALNKLAASTAHNAATFNSSGFLAGGVAPGISGNVLTSNGTDWTSAAVPGITTGNLTDAGTDGITVTGGTGAVIGSGTSFSQAASSGSQNGYLSSANFTVFNNKQAAGNYITALTGDGTAAGPGSAALTLATVNASPGTTAISTVTTNGKGLVTANSAASTTGSGNVVLATSPTLSSPVVGTQASSDNSTLAASTAYVQTALAQLNPAAAVYAASTANIAGTYVNAVSGVCIGDTFTVTATGALAIDGVNPPLASRVLLKNQTSTFQDGIWTVTVAGTTGVSPVLTRALDFDSTPDINAGSIVPVVNGTVNAGSSWYQTATVVTCNTDSQTWTQFQKASSAYVSSTLTNTHLFVGNASNVATDVAASGDLTLANTGAFTVAKIQGTTVSGTTGSGNVVFSASPTLTGSLTVPTIYGSSSASGNLTLNSTSNATNGNVILQSAGGNVGVGTTSPVNEFDVTGTNQTFSSNYWGNAAIVTSDTAAADKGGSLTLGGKYTGGTEVGYASIKSGADGSFSDLSGGYLSFYTTSQDVYPTEKMRITSGGNVGIGTSAPSSLLTVNGATALGIAGVTLGTLAFNGNTSGTVTMESAAAAGTWTMTLPTGAGNSGQYLQTNGSGVTSWVSAAANQALTTCTTARTVDWSTGNSFTLVLTNADTCAITFSNATSGQTVTITYTQPGTTGSAVVSYSTTVKWPGGTVPTMTTGANATDTCTFIYNGTDYRGSCLQNFQ